MFSPLAATTRIQSSQENSKSMMAKKPGSILSVPRKAFSDRSVNLNSPLPKPLKTSPVLKVECKIDRKLAEEELCAMDYTYSYIDKEDDYLDFLWSDNGFKSEHLLNIVRRYNLQHISSPEPRKDENTHLRDEKVQMFAFDDVLKDVSGDDLMISDDSFEHTLPHTDFDDDEFDTSI